VGGTLTGGGRRFASAVPGVDRVLRDVRLRAIDVGEGLSLGLSSGAFAFGASLPGLQALLFSQVSTCADAAELAPAPLESKCMPSPGGQISGMARARNPVDLPKGYHTPAGLRQVDGMPHEPGAVWRSKLLRYDPSASV